MGRSCHHRAVLADWVEDLQVIWEAVTALAAVAAMLIPEGKPEKEADQG